MYAWLLLHGNCVVVNTLFVFRWQTNFTKKKRGARKILLPSIISILLSFSLYNCIHKDTNKINITYLCSKQSIPFGIHIHVHDVHGNIRECVYLRIKVVLSVTSFMCLRTSLLSVFVVIVAVRIEKFVFLFLLLTKQTFGLLLLLFI